MTGVIAVGAQIGRTDAAEWRCPRAWLPRPEAAQVCSREWCDLTRPSPFDKVALFHRPDGQWSIVGHRVVGDPHRTTKRLRSRSDAETFSLTCDAAESVPLVFVQ